ncbi:unnamed protein product [Strongylus vulgaris]|uniref:Uncharacterized protein n=1 Tax=Strongylus vulgaris TaxID=40348 RepID=A0A3P7IXD0_STRVU|nr:unnamed protein product [Strongylus vulgaris]
MLGIAIGVLLLVYPSWHEFLLLYKQTLTLLSIGLAFRKVVTPVGEEEKTDCHLLYLRRNDPNVYWLYYRIFLSCWIAMHFIHLCTIIASIFGAQMTKARLLAPQMIVLVFKVGLYIVGSFALTVISVTSAKVTWMAMLIIFFFAFFTTTNLIVLVRYHRVLEEKNIALRALLANTKSVHFKERRAL